MPAFETAPDAAPGADALDTDAYIADFADFIQASPSSYHAAAEVARRLEAAGFDAARRT